MIKFEEVSRWYDAKKPAVERLSLQIEQGKTTVLLGSSGCGKTTTLRMINRLIEPSEGRITLRGQNIGQQAPEKLRRTMGYVIQQAGLFPHWTVAKNIATVPRLLGWKQPQIEARVAELLALVGLDPSMAQRFPHQLSGGQQQRVGVARALAADPPILLMDEPFGALDPLSRQHIQQAFLAIQQRLHKTVILVTHDIDEAFLLADSLVLMHEGKLIQSGSPLELIFSPTSEFVTQFLGQDAWLRYLATLPVARLLQDTSRMTESGVSEGSSDMHSLLGDPISGDLDARTALSLLLSRGEGSLAVRMQNEKLDYLTLAHYQHLKAHQHLKAQE